jgi:Lrp/AsnC family transcriptional regulator, regulator for asnA, asnC and gidA
MKIDEINSKILKDLLVDGRKSFKEIAEECHTSKDVIAKRYKQMKTKGIITGATIQNSCDCYNSNFIANIEIRTQLQKEDQVMQALKQMPQVFDFYSVGVTPGFVVSVLLKSIGELDNIKDAIKKVPHVLETETMICTGFRNNPENLSIFDFLTKDKTPKIVQKKSVLKIDSTDSQIIELLTRNGRLPFTKISEELNVSTDTVIRRYERLKQNGDVRVVIQLDPLKIGYYALAVFKLVFSYADDGEDKADLLSKISDVTLIHKTSGCYDFVILVLVRDIVQLMAVQKQLKNLASLNYMDVNFVELKGSWPHPREFISTF